MSDFIHPSLDDIEKRLETIKEIEKQLESAKQQLYESIAELPSKIGDNQDLQDEVFHHLYWFREDIPGGYLKDIFQVKPPGTKKTGHIILRTVFAEAICYDCKQTFDMEVTSRTATKKGRGICKECDAIRHTQQSQQQAQWQKRREQAALRKQELHNMPYREYLQTDEWQERRRQAMKRARFRCQLCNADKVRLNTHHRTYERRGYEDDKDLIVLCENCHSIFHKNGSLASNDEVER